MFKKADIKIDLLTTKEIYGKNESRKGRLEIFKKIDEQTYGTCLAALTSNWNGYGCDCSYITKTSDNEKDVIRVNPKGYVKRAEIKDRTVSIRPVLRLSKNLLKEIRSYPKIYHDGIFIVHFGEYPQDVLNDPRIIYRLEENYRNGTLRKTGKTYTFDGINPDNQDKPFTPKTYEEYIYEEKTYTSEDRKYIRLTSNYTEKDYKWIEVEPISWIIDFKSRTLISRRSLLSGIRFNDKEYHGDFESTEMYEFLNNYMLRDIFQKEPDNKIELNKNTLNEVIKKIEVQIEEENLSKEDLELLEGALKQLKKDTKKQRR